MKYLYLISICFLLFVSCNRDDSTGITRVVSEITIEDETEGLNVDLGFELVRKVSVQQTMSDMPLAYEWAVAPYIADNSIDTLKVISNEEELHYTFRQRGKYRLRLKVSNEHEAVFKNYDLWVNAAFEEGVMMLAENETGDGNLSFLKTLTSEEIEAGKEEKILEHCFSMLNPGIDMKNPIGFAKIPGDTWFGRQPKFILAISDKIYFADPSTLELIGTIPIDGEYAGEKARTFVATDYAYCSPFIQTENGKIIHIEKDFHYLYNNSYIWFQDANAGLYEDIIVQLGIASGNAGIESLPFFINYTNSILDVPYTNMGLAASSRDLDLFKNENIITVFKENVAYGSKMYAISSPKENPKQIIIRQLEFDLDFDAWTTWLIAESNYAYELSASDKYPARGTRLVGCATYRMAFWHEGSEIYAWNYLNAEPKFPSAPVIDVKQADNAGTNMEITYMATSNALKNYRPVNVDKWLYVGVYDKDTKRGSLYIYECDKIGQPGLKPYKQFDNQTDRIKFITDKTR